MVSILLSRTKKRYSRAKKSKNLHFSSKWRSRGPFLHFDEISSFSASDEFLRACIYTTKNITKCLYSSCPYDLKVVMKNSLISFQNTIFELYTPSVSDHWPVHKSSSLRLFLFFSTETLEWFSNETLGWGSRMRGLYILCIVPGAPEKNTFLTKVNFINKLYAKLKLMIELKLMIDLESFISQ